MKLSRLLPIVILLFCWQGLSAQDVHYTLFNMSPLRTNPALTGAFNGTARLGGIYRGQWFNLDASMTTPSFYVDAPIIRGFRDRDWVGVGLMFLSDQAGPFDLQTSLGGLSASYHLALDKKATSILTLGAQYGQATRKATFNNPLAQQNIETNFGGGGENETEFNAMGNADKNTNYNDISAGLLYRTQLDKTSALELGLSALHLNSPSAGLLGSGGGVGVGTGGQDADRKMTFITHGKYDRMLDEKWSMSPTFFFQTTEGGGNEIVLQAWAGRKVNEDLTLNFGLGGRFGDAGQVLFGADYKDIRAALSYDVNLSSASTITNNVGGFEISAYYIIKIYKQPEIPPAILCPRF
ncbi:MAG: hypothetical protein DA408_11140 [Bacteroidetes bacterium]|nr:MAG: hypothetical protein C7N36_09220 [Bacteroidota bacterium]PTM12323.1 MAG: hypothetical protein DA408_11140 [Bacteroidota bacterium]